MLSKWYKKKARQWKKIKFTKKIVVSCIIIIVIYTIFQTYMSYMLRVELSPTLTTCVYAFFGTELAVTAAIRIFDKEDQTTTTTTTTHKGESSDDNQSVG